MQFPHCVLGVFLALPLFAQPHPSFHVGFYHWDGAYHASVSEGMDAIAAVGGQIARLVVSARMNVDYGMGASCIPDFTLAGAMQDPDMKKALDNPAISVFMLTAYDGVTFGDCVTLRFLNPTFYTPSNEAAIVQEYSDLTLYLYQINIRLLPEVLETIDPEFVEIFGGAEVWVSIRIDGVSANALLMVR
jgi:hypothetical protein